MNDRPPTGARLRLAAQNWLQAERAGVSARLLAAGVGRVAARRGRRTRARARVPTIVVGAISLGGAGKTPVVQHLARRLRPAEVVIIGHGYGARLDRPTEVAGADAARFGDEAAALWRALRAEGMSTRIVVGGDRAARHRWAEARAEVILVDDGFQDPRLPRTADLVVVDATAGRRVMPAGPLREPLGALARADGIWLHKVDEPGARPLSGCVPAVTSRVAPRAVRLPDGRRVGVDWLRGRALRPLCAIGRPGSFHHSLIAAGASLLPGCTRADHHRFSTAELARLPPGGWITTTKDRVRLPLDFEAAVLEVDVELCSGGGWLAERLAEWTGR